MPVGAIISLPSIMRSPFISLYVITSIIVTRIQTRGVQVNIQGYLFLFVIKEIQNINKYIKFILYDRIEPIWVRP